HVAVVGVPGHALLLAPREHVVLARGGLDAWGPVAVDAVALARVDLGHAAVAAGHDHVAAQVDRGPRGLTGALWADLVAADLGEGLGVDLADGALGAVGDPDVRELELTATVPAAGVAGGVGGQRVELRPAVVVVGGRVGL